MSGCGSRVYGTGRKSPHRNGWCSGKKQAELVSDRRVLLSANFVTVAFSFPTGIGKCILKSCGED